MILFSSQIVQEAFSIFSFQVETIRSANISNNNIQARKDISSQNFEKA